MSTNPHPSPARPLVVVDIGHGPYVNDGAHVRANPAQRGHLRERYNDPGFVVGGHGRIRSVHGAPASEAYIASQVAVALRAQLEARGFEVAFTRTPTTQDDYWHTTDGGYTTRDPEASRYLPDKYETRLATGAAHKALHLSIHADSRPAGSGLNVYYSDKLSAGSSSAAFARMLGGGSAEPHKTDLLETNMLHNTPAALVEVGNMRNANDLNRMMSPAGQQAIASLLASRVGQFYESLRTQRPELPGLRPSPTANVPVAELLPTPPPMGIASRGSGLAH